MALPAAASPSLEFFQVNAFASKPFTGNSAAVVLLPSEREDTWLQLVAREFKLSETAFLVRKQSSTPSTPDDEFCLRWFTPAQEVDLCGHATLAAAHALFSLSSSSSSPSSSFRTSSSTITFHTRSGPLSATQLSLRDSPLSRLVASGGGAPLPTEVIELDFPIAPAQPFGQNEKEGALLNGQLQEALGGGVSLKWLGRSDLDYLLVEVDSEALLLNLSPDMALLAQVPHLGLIVTAPAGEAAAGVAAAGGAAAGGAAAGVDGADCQVMKGRPDFVSRFFAPRAGIDEDPVTGSAHCVLGPFWAERLGKTELLAYQASERGGYVGVRVDKSKGRVFLHGSAVTVMQGRLLDQQ